MAGSQTVGAMDRISGATKVGAAATAFLAYSAVKASIDYESAFAEVRKTVDTSEGGFRRLSAGIREMSTEIPVSATNLAMLAGEAGALGISAGSLLDFTKIAAQLGVTTNMSSEQAAVALARVGNVMGATKGDYSRMAAAVVDLGNKGASTESEISEMALRFVGVAKQIGLSTDEVFGFSAALANIGEDPEAGGSAISRAFIEMSSAVSKGGKDLQGFAQVAGVSAQSFSREWEQDPARAMTRFISGLGRMKKEGGDAIETLEELGLSDIRVRRALLGLAGRPKELAKALGISEKAWKENTAAQDEYNKKVQTTESQIGILKNRMTELMRGIGDDLKPAVDVGVKGLSGIFDGLNTQMQQSRRDMDQMLEPWEKMVTGGDSIMSFEDMGPMIDQLGEASGKMLRLGKMSGEAKREVSGFVNALPKAQFDAFWESAGGAKMQRAVGQLRRIAGQKVATRVALEGTPQVTRQLGQLAARAKQLGGGRQTVKILADTTSPKQKISALQRQIAQLKNKNVRVNAETGSAQGRVRGLKGEIDSIPSSKTVTIYMKTVGRFPGFASGGQDLKEQVGVVGEKGRELARTAKGQWMMLGDRGPHLFPISEGMDIYTAAETKALLRMGIPGFAKGKEGKRKKQIAQGKRIAKPINKAAGRAEGSIENLEEIVDMATRAAAFPESPSGEELSGGERSELITLNQQLENLLKTRVGELRKVLSARSPKGAGAASVKEAKTRARDTLKAIQGTTGRGGKLFDVRETIARLKGETTAAGGVGDSKRAGLTAEQLKELSYLTTLGVTFDPNVVGAAFGGSFYKGGVVPGPPGAPRNVIAHGGERIGNDGGSVVLIVEDGAVDVRKIRQIAGDEAEVRIVKRDGAEAMEYLAART